MLFSSYCKQLLIIFIVIDIYINLGLGIPNPTDNTKFMMSEYSEWKCKEHW